MATTYKPGEIVSESGIYVEISVAGNKQAEVTCVKGEPFPPTTTSGYYYELVRAARHRNSEG